MRRGWVHTTKEKRKLKIKELKDKFDLDGKKDTRLPPKRARELARHIRRFKGEENFENWQEEERYW